MRDHSCVSSRGRTTLKWWSEMGFCRNDVLETRTSGTSSVRLTDARITTKTQPHRSLNVCALAARYWVHRRGFIRRCQVDLLLFFVLQKQFLGYTFAMRHQYPDFPCLLQDATYCTWYTCLRDYSWVSSRGRTPLTWWCEMGSCWKMSLRPAPVERVLWDSTMLESTPKHNLKVSR
jgi:hypothetical protein